jgi:hypothetical protein
VGDRRCAMPPGMPGSVDYRLEVDEGAPAVGSPPCGGDYIVTSPVRATNQDRRSGIARIGLDLGVLYRVR